MYRVDAALAVVADFQPRPQIADFSMISPNTNSGMSFGEHLNTQLQATMDVAQTQLQINIDTTAKTQLTQTPAASFLAWYFPPEMISPKAENRIEKELNQSTD
jgi:hypothetical protein